MPDPVVICAGCLARIPEGQSCGCALAMRQMDELLLSAQVDVELVRHLIRRGSLLGRGRFIAERLWDASATLGGLAEEVRSL